MGSGRRARKNHRQLSLLDRTGTKKADPRKGKARGGRPRKYARGCSPHKTRESFRPYQPVHVTLRIVESVGSLRRRFFYVALRAATLVAATNHAARIVHISVQSNHVHLLVEAPGAAQLTKLMQGFQISAAKGINRIITKRTGTKRRGKVFADRYHVEVIRTPTQARNALAYVLNNWRKHGEHRVKELRGWRVDPWSTGALFTGWKEGARIDRGRFPASHSMLMVSEPRTWLLTAGWRKSGELSVYELPSATVFRRRMAKVDAKRWAEVAREREAAGS